MLSSVILRRRLLSKLSKALVLVAAIFYFSYHMISGEKGVLAMMQLQQRVNTAHIDLNNVEMEKIKMRNRVKSMYSNSLDKDLVDEQARRLLGYAGKDEIVLLDY